MKRNKTYRIRTGVNDGVPSISFNIDSSVETYEILSLKISQKNAYKLMASDKGVVAGRVLANGGFGVPNARVSIFVPYEDEENMKQQILYHFASAQSLDDNGIRYNLLPDGSDDDCHQVVGTFPNKRIMLDDDNWVEVFDKYYRYTTRTNASGDYMIYGVPTGDQAIHMDVDLSDIGPLSQRPRDMMIEGYTDTMFESPSKFKSGTNLNSLVQIKSEDTSLYVYPFWGDTTTTNTNACITRHDIPINYTFKPTCVFLGSVITDTGENALSKKCVGSKKQGKMSDMVTGEGKIEMIRKTFDGNTEQFSIQGNHLIDSNGTWCYQIPMNLDYVMTDEFGNTVLSDNPEKGIPTRARVRFRISMSESPNDATARKRARYLVPNNPHLNSEDFTDYPEYTKTKEPDYEFGTDTKDENFRDLMWNNVYTVKSYIPRIQKSNLPNNLRHIGIKMVNHPQGNNPMPFNNLRIKMNFNYMFMCALVKVLVYMTLGINTVLTLVSYAFFRVAQFIIAITNVDMLGSPALAGFWSTHDNKYKRAEDYGDHNVNPFYDSLTNHHSGLGEDADADGTTQPYKAACFMLAIIGKIAATYNPNSNQSEFKYINDNIGINYPPFYYNNKRVGVKGFAAKLMAVVYKIGCGITLRGLCETEDGEELNTSPGTLDLIKKIFEDAQAFFKDGSIHTCDDDVAKLFNCIENELAQENEVTSFNFYNDWINGTLYFPLWYRKIKPKRKFFGLFTIKAKDQWCSADTTWIKSTQDKRQIKIYDTCVQKKSFDGSSGEMGVKFKPLEDDYQYVNVNDSIADDDTGIEVLIFKQDPNTNNGINEDTCYGYQCHKHARTTIPVRSGLMKEKETMLGDLVYYYKPCEYNTKYTKDIITLFATDIVLLGSLSDCDLHGVPQFFKALEGTTYNMPPSLLSETYEYKTDANAIYTDETDSDMITEGTRKTEYTGADWGNLGMDQSNWKRVKNNITYEANENIYDNGGLFYGITCFTSFTKPKSCINLSRICEFGISLDESQDILSTSALQSAASVDDISEDTMYKSLTPDGFVSYDEIYNPDYRSMFATMNANFLRTKLNYNTGMYEYDFNHLYIDNFDGIMSKLMQSPSVMGKTKESTYTLLANYTGNYNLEKSSDAYLNFRYGNYKKNDSGGNKIYLYDYNKDIAKVKGAIINSNKRLPRYENSFYFYFGLLEGKTAIDRFYSTYYSECTNDVVLPKNYEITPTPNTVCLGLGEYDGNILFSFNSEPPINITITNKNNDMDVYTITDVPYSQFYIGTIDPSEVPVGYIHADIICESTSSPVDFIANGIYKVLVTTGDGDIIQTEIRLEPDDITFNVDVYNFTCKNTELDSLFSVTNPDGSYDWSQMFPAIADYTDDGVQITNTIKRAIGGYVIVNVADLQRFSIGIEPVSTYFFMDGGSMLYSAPHIDVIDGTVCNQSGNGYLGEHNGYVFGVPYGGQKYKVVVSELCYDEDTNTIQTTEHKTSEIVTVGEGVFQMFINNIDYDIIKSFRTGWTVTPATKLKSQNQQFNYSLMYGWNELSNIGKFYNPTNSSVEDVRYINYITDDNSVIIAIGDVLCDDYDGNGVDTPIVAGSTEHPTPYTWDAGRCINSELWGEYKDKSTRPITATHTFVDSVTGDVSEETITGINRTILQNNNEYIATYTYISNGQTVLVCTEHENGDMIYEDDYSNVNGLTLQDIMSIASNIKSVIDNRDEYVRKVRGAFRIGATETKLTVTYRTPSTPVRYLIGGNIEISANTQVQGYSGSMFSQLFNSESDTRVVFDSSLATNNIIFSLPTVTYDRTAHEYKPYVMRGVIGGVVTDINKIPYFVSIQNSQGMAIPTNGSNIPDSSQAQLFVDNFGQNRFNPYLFYMFGVHFFDNPIYYSQVLVVCGFSYMPKYDNGNNTFITVDSLVMGYAVNGLSPVTVTLDYDTSLVKVASEPLQDVDEEFYRTQNNRLMYDDSQTYGKYVLNPNFVDEHMNTLEYQYMTFPRNRFVLVQDEYGPGYESTVYCDYEINTDNIKLTAPANQTIGVQMGLTRSASGTTRYYVFRYTGTNHPLNIAIHNTGDGTWSFPGDIQTGEMNYMFKPETILDDCNPQPIAIVNGNGVFTYQPDPQYNANPLFIVAQNDNVGIRVFSPVFEFAHIMSIYHFQATPPTQDGYTIYLLRRPMNNNDRQHCDITDFKYYTQYPFTLVLKQYNDDTGGADEVLRYEINPSPSDIVRIQLDDVDENNNPVTTYGMALKISLTQHQDDFSGYGSGNRIPNWLSLWGIDVNGVERSLIGVTGDNTTVTENP